MFWITSWLSDMHNSGKCMNVRGWAVVLFILLCFLSVIQQKGLTGVNKAVQPDAEPPNNRSSYQTSHEVFRKIDSFGGEQEASEGSKWGQWCVCVEHFQLCPVPLRGKSLFPSSLRSLDSDIQTMSATRSNPLDSLLPQTSYSALPLYHIHSTCLCPALSALQLGSWDYFQAGTYCLSLLILTAGRLLAVIL